MGRSDTATLPPAVDITKQGDMLKIAVPPDADFGNAVVWLVTYLDRADVAIDKGENAGKTMVYTRVVTGRQALGMWESATGADLKLPLPEMLAENTGMAVIVQQEKMACPARSRVPLPSSAKPPPQTKETPVPGGRNGRLRLTWSTNRLVGNRTSWFGGSFGPAANHWRQC
ncbi:DUF1223 domain-containing protein [Devosia sp. A8/3-2]|nr:DUF1223 domain-containing protein [Devosia sp. A8/3-2]